MLRMANVYLTEGNHENAYILYMKYMILFIEKIRDHPDYDTVPTDIKQPIRTKLKEILPITEKLKVKLLDRYQKEYDQFLANKEAEKIVELEREKKEKLAKKSGSNIPANLHVQVDPSVQPTAPDSSLLDQVVYPNDFPTGSNRANLPSSGLLLPADSEKLNTKQLKPAPPSSSESKPTFDRNQKPYLSSENDKSESLLAGSFRTVLIPYNTMSLFLQLVKTNTFKNIETCGILAGRLTQNQFLITHIILPKQHGTADSCNTSNEEELFDIQDKHNLITLGWIHVNMSEIR